MHKILLLALAFSLSLNFYFFMQGTEPESDSVSSIQSAVKLDKSRIPDLRHKNNIEIIEDEILPEKRDQNITERPVSEKDEELATSSLSNEQYKQTQERWDKETRAFLERDLGLNPELASFYFELANKRRLEIDAYLTPKIEENREVFGFTIEDNIHLSKINEKYLNFLKTAIGEENYEQYKNYRARQNKKFMEEGLIHYWIEY